MALDVGSKNIGVAVTDFLKITVRPLTTVRRSDLQKDAETVLRLARRHNVEKIIVGRPLYLNGRSSAVLKAIEPLFELLRNCCPFPVLWAEERLSSREAESLLGKMGVPPQQRRRRRDEVAAALILKWYLQESGSS